LPKPVRTVVFIVATGVLLTGLLTFGLPNRVGGLSALVLALFMAGGFSNLVDRVLRGSVIDFLNVGIGHLRTGVFNVADVAIMAGAALLTVDAIRERQARPSSGGE
jgi:signal peptidase II